MITEQIKTVLGETLAKQVEDALKGKGKEGKDIDLVCGNDGTHVPLEQYDGEKRRATAAELALKTAAEAVKTLGGSGDPQKLQDDVNTAKGALDTLNAEHKTAITKIQRETALRMALSGKVHDPADVMRLLELDKVDVGEDGTLKTDLAPLLKTIQETKPYLFKAVEQPPLSGAIPAKAQTGEPQKQYTSEELGKLSMDEYAAYRSKQTGFPRN